MGRRTERHQISAQEMQIGASVMTLRILKSAIWPCLLVLLLTVVSRTLAQGTYSVAILVIDDFGGNTTIPAATPVFEATDNCAVDLEGQSYATRGASSTPITVPHGELVIEEFEQIFTALGTPDAYPLVPVDIHGATTEDIVLRIQEAMAAQPADLYVANMSFAIIPCEFLDEFQQTETELAQAQAAHDTNGQRGIFQRAVTFYDQQVYPVNSQHFQNATDLDPLQSFLAQNQGVIVPVASAGNFGLRYPFWPGAWGEVISVSASTGQGFDAPSAWDRRRDTPLLSFPAAQGNSTTLISNYGEVMLPGEFTSVEGALSGTSFAAPRFSVALARYLSAVGTGYCRNNNGYLALITGNWTNPTLDATVASLCPAMAAYLP
jgi:hypothetical protein